MQVPLARVFIILTKKMVHCEQKKTSMKNIQRHILPCLNILIHISKIIALIFGIALLIAAAIEVYGVFVELTQQNISEAIQEGLFVLILLEMLYVVRSFIKYESINVGIVVNVGVVAAVKELIFVMKDLTLELGAAFSMLFVSLAIIYFLEERYYVTFKEVKRPRLE
jgi:uncharacterized membrane protein (DUF373 family)